MTLESIIVVGIVTALCGAAIYTLVRRSAAGRARTHGRGAEARGTADGGAAFGSAGWGSADSGSGGGGFDGGGGGGGCD